MRLQTLLMICALLPVFGAHAAVTDPQRQVAVVDSVVAVVNADVVTRLELDKRVAIAVAQLKRRGTPLPEGDALQRQMLERMIGELLLEQFARENGIRVDESQVDLAISGIAQNNKFSTVAAFRAELQRQGVDYDSFRNEIRNELVTRRVREREVESKLIISDSEVDAYLANKERMGSATVEMHLAHILVVVPEQADAARIGAARSAIEGALKQLRDGADFAQVAAGVSNARDALSGGDLGWRSTDRIPPGFLSELQMLKPGQTTGVIRSPSGFHILKLIDRRNETAPVLIEQTHARHILIKTSEVVPEAEARKRIMEIKRRIDAGADFAAEAKRHSQDGSASGGGDLGWLSPGQTVMEFEQTMNALTPGKVAAVQTQFGWHLVEVLERRNTDVSEQQRRDEARQVIGSFKSDDLYQDWLRQLRDRAFIEYRDDRS